MARNICTHTHTEKRLTECCRYKDELNTFSGLKIRVTLRQMSRTMSVREKVGGRGIKDLKDLKIKWEN